MNQGKPSSKKPSSVEPDTPKTESDQSQPTKNPDTDPQKKSNTALKVVLIIVGVLVVLAIAGAAASSFIFSSLIKRATNNGAVSVKNNSIEVKGKDGNTMSVGENASLPKDFPSDVPIYPGGKVVIASKYDGDKFNATLATKDDSNKVGSYYEDELTKNGWSSDNQNSYSTSAIQSMNYIKDNRLLIVNITAGSKANNETMISLTVKPEDNASSSD